MSLLSDHIESGTLAGPGNFHRVRPQILRSVLRTLGDAVAATAEKIGPEHVLEPRFTRQLAVDLETLRAANPTAPRYDVTHQPELPILDADGVVIRYRRLDIRLLFPKQIGRPGDYLGVECKYLDADDRRTDAEYVDEGVQRILSGEYSRGHPWAIMVGLERAGPLDQAMLNVDARLRERYGSSAGFKNTCCVTLSNVRESEHAQDGSSHAIGILHGFFLLAA